MPLVQARELAKKSNLDIVEVAPTSVPPVCRLLDYGKFKYEQQKKEQQSKKSQKVTLLREIRLRPKIGVHDFEFKAKTARKLLVDGAKVKVTLMFRGREITHPDLGWKILQRMAETLKEVGVLERQPVMEGRRMDIIMAPAGSKPKVKAEVKAETKTAIKTEAKTVVKAEAKTAVKTEAKTAVKAEAKTAVKTEVKETQNA
jgi:translation initiation factor IF-3